MATVQHPTWPAITREVDGRSVSRWERSGWVRVDKPRKAQEPQPDEG